METCETILKNAKIVNRYGQQLSDYTIAVGSGKIIWVGPTADFPDSYYHSEPIVEDCRGDVITPGLIDCHTHLIYAGNRAQEFMQRLEGSTYAEIARQGGGILSTVKQTRAASEEQLIIEALPRLFAMISRGVTTVEIKSGYGLDLETETKMLKVAKKLGDLTGIRVKTTFLGAHALPEEYRGQQQAYVDYLCEEMLPTIAELGLIDAVDVFCESIGFTLHQTEQVFLAAQQIGLPVKCHAEQLSNIGASQLAAKFHALSSDHLEFLDIDAIEAMGKVGTVAVLLPGAFYFLHEQQKPPIHLLRQAGVGMAIATDCNPGSSPTTDLLLMMNMACQLFALTVPEALSGVTYQASRALGIDKEVGCLEKGMMADLVKWSISDAAQLCYEFGTPIDSKIMIAGQWQVNHNAHKIV